MTTKRKLILLFLVPSVCFAGYGWRTYVDPKVEALWKAVQTLHKRIDNLEARVVDIEKGP